MRSRNFGKRDGWLISANGSAWGTSRALLEQFLAGDLLEMCGPMVFLGQEHRILGPACAEAKASMAKNGWAARFAPAAATAAAAQDPLRTSVGVLPAVNSHICIEFVAPRSSGNISLAGCEGRLVACWINLLFGRGLVVLSIYLWHSETWSARNLALVQAVLSLVRSLPPGTLWVLGGDFNMDPALFSAHLVAQELGGQILAPSVGTFCGSSGEWKTFDYFVPCRPFAVLVGDVKVLGEAGTAPHLPVAVKFSCRPLALYRCVLRAPCRLHQWRVRRLTFAPRFPMRLPMLGAT